MPGSSASEGIFKDEGLEKDEKLERFFLACLDFPGVELLSHIYFPN
jgi:hypothetical protein